MFGTYQINLVNFRIRPDFRMIWSVQYLNWTDLNLIWSDFWFIWSLLNFIWIDLIWSYLVALVSLKPPFQKINKFQREQHIRFESIRSFECLIWFILDSDRPDLFVIRTKEFLSVLKVKEQGAFSYHSWLSSLDHYSSNVNCEKDSNF